MGEDSKVGDPFTTRCQASPMVPMMGSAYSGLSGLIGNALVRESLFRNAETRTTASPVTYMGPDDPPFLIVDDTKDFVVRRRRRRSHQAASGNGRTGSIDHGGWRHPRRGGSRPREAHPEWSGLSVHHAGCGRRATKLNAMRITANAGETVTLD